LPLVTAVAVFSLWSGRLDEAYWFLVLAPSAAVALFGGMNRVDSRARIIFVGLLALLICEQPVTFALFLSVRQIQHRR
jgi:hypothetical protein